MADPAFTGEFERMLREYAGTPSLLYDATRLSERRRRPDPAQARGPQPHRRPQDPQRARPGAAHQADGQDPGDRRDRRRAARRRDGDRGGVPRPRVRGLHGRGRHRAAGAQRRPDAAARRRGGPGDQSGSRTLKDAINEALRDWVASVDHTAYLFGTAAGPHPFPSMVRDFVPRHRRRGPRAVPGADRRPARRGHRLRRRRLQRDRAVRRVRRRRRRAARRLRGGRRRLRDRSGTPRRSAPATSACCTAPAPSCCRTRTARRVESHSISAGLDYPGVGPEHAYLAETGRADVPSRSPTPQAMEAFAAALPHRGDHPGDRVGARGRRHHASWPRRCRARRSWSTSPAAATRTWARAMEWFGPGRRPTTVSRQHLPTAFAKAKAEGAPRWSATCPPGSRRDGSIEAIR